MTMNAITVLLAAVALLLAAALASSRVAGGRGLGDPEFDMPGLGGGGIPAGWAGAFGGGESGPDGGRSWSGTQRPTTVCMEKGPCHKKRLRCPARCFKAWARSGKDFGEGGGEGGCIVDCKKKCIAYC